VELKILIYCLLSTSLWAQHTRPEQPNIIVILTDDLGWQDVQCYDVDDPTHAHTPNIDALAAKGAMFRQAYSPAPTCSPSRAAIVSGIHPARSQNTHINGGKPPSPDKNHAKVLITPWYSGRVSLDQPSIADTLKAGGYTTGMTGKWHCSANLYSYPQPSDVGFDHSSHDEDYMLKTYGSYVKGIQERIAHPDNDGDGKPDNLDYRPTQYSTTSSEKYPLDKNGFPIDPVQLDTLAFIDKNKDKPFFLYNATWLVHAPIQCRSEGIVMKYYNEYVADMEASNAALVAKGEEPEAIEPLLGHRWSVRGRNPYYLGMIEILDYYIGQTINYLETTEDPRWPGHKLIENTYIVFTSDNGGVISARAEQITDNSPLVMGKKYTNEGGLRVPFIVTGPGIAPGTDSHVMVNGLDIYPTALKWAGLEKPKNTTLDGCDLSTLLSTDPTDSSLVLENDGKERTKMYWHFPHETQSSSVIRHKDYKLIVNYGHKYINKLNEFELYRLYNGDKRVDIEEADNLIDSSRIESLKTDLDQFLEETGATLPYLNPKSSAIKDGSNALIPTATNVSVTSAAAENSVKITYAEHGAALVKSYIIYRLSDEQGAEWFRNETSIDTTTKTVTGSYPLEATSAIFTFIDENNFLTSFSASDLTSNKGKKRQKK